MELEDFVIGLVAEEYLSCPDGPIMRTHYKTGYLAYWLGAAFASPFLPAPAPAHWGSGRAKPPVQLPHLRMLSFLGSVDAGDVAALVVAAPRLSSLCFHGVIGEGALKILALPALPQLDHLELHAAIQVAHRRLELPLVLTDRPPLDVLRLLAADDTKYDTTSAGGWLWGLGELWEGVSSSVAIQCELVASTVDNVMAPWVYDDATVKWTCGQGTSPSETADANGSFGSVPHAGATIASAEVKGWAPATSLRSLTIALGPTATDSAVASLAALPALSTLRLGLTKATNVRLSSWPTFRSLTRLALMMSITRADGAVSVVLITLVQLPVC